MNRIEKLIQEHCPDGVPFYSLRDVAPYSKIKIKATELDSTNFVGVDNLRPNFGGREDSAYGPNAKTATEYSQGDVLIGNIRPYLKKVWLADRKGGASGDVLVLSLNETGKRLIAPGFLYWNLTSDAFISYNNKFARGGKMPRGDKNKILDYRVPVPPLVVQREIVKVLDLFTELEAELEVRRKQYEYYRDQLLTFPEDGGATWVELGDLLEMRAGKFLSASEIGEKQTRERSIPCYGANGVRGYTSEANNFDSRVLIGRQGALSGNVHLAAAPFYATDHAVVCNPRSYLELNFFYHVLSHAHLGQFVTKSAQPGLSVRRLKTVRVPVPPMETQRRIANVLDKFDTLVNDLSSGLPAEIEARRKQYEYYRDKLLTFKELEAAAA